MNYQDLTDYNPQTVLFIKDPSIIEISRNPLYTPILSILRAGIKTLKEIKEEYMKHSSKKEIPSDKSLYRHLKYLKEAGLISEVGKRVYTDQAMTEKLFGRTAVFFYLKDDEEFDPQSEENETRATLLSKIFKITFDIPQPSTECMLKIMQKIRENSKEGHTILFEENIDEIAELLGEVALDDLRRVVETFVYVNLLQNKSKFTKELKECLKIS